jgi:hypothetical protein
MVHCHISRVTLGAKELSYALILYYHDGPFSLVTGSGN